jgi:hypothetical protein
MSAFGDVDDDADLDDVLSSDVDDEPSDPPDILDGDVLFSVAAQPPLVTSHIPRDRRRARQSGSGGGGGGGDGDEGEDEPHTPGSSDLGIDALSDGGSVPPAAAAPSAPGV